MPVSRGRLWTFWSVGGVLLAFGLTVSYLEWRPGLALLPAVNAILTPLASMLGFIAQNHAAAIAFAVIIGGVLAGAIGTKAVHALTDMKDAMKTVAGGMESLVGKIRGTASASDAQAAASKKAGDAAKESAAMAASAASLARSTRRPRGAVRASRSAARGGRPRSARRGRAAP